LALEHARDEVTRARRQYDAVDPANRLVAAELERRWNQALTTEAQLEAEFVALQEGRDRPLADTQKQELLALARDLPRPWDDPQSLPEHKKRLLRIALKEIIATCEGEMICLILHWQGGDHTKVEFQKIGTGRHRYVTVDDFVEIVRMLARTEPDARIASTLNRNQRRTAHGQNWTAKRICSLRNNHGGGSRFGGPAKTAPPMASSGDWTPARLNWFHGRRWCYNSYFMAQKLGVSRSLSIRVVRHFCDSVQIDVSKQFS
jgi:hypothetical protein